MLEIVTIPCLSDNYAYLLADYAAGRAALVDAPEAAPIQTALSTLGLPLTDILITHHHNDHIAAVDTLRNSFGATVWGAAADAHRLPALDHKLQPGDAVPLGTTNADVLDVSGHTIGHIAFYVPAARAAFTADSLMTLGCGRLFEGSAAVMWDSLSRLAALPGDTQIWSGHEYTTGNIAFARTIEPDNPALAKIAAEVEAKRRNGVPSVGLTLREECAANPFLRAGIPGVKDRVGLPGAPDEEVFAEIRARKDRF